MVPPPNSRVFGFAVAGRLPEIIEASFAGACNDSPSLVFGSELESELIGFADCSLDTSSFKDVADYHVGAAIALAKVRNTCKIIGDDLIYRKVDSLICSSDVFDFGGLLLSSEILESNFSGFTHCSEFNSRLLESSPYWSNGAGVFLRELGQAEPSEVVSNDLLTRQLQLAVSSKELGTVRVTGRFKENFTGHVFTSETATGYYRVSPLGILSKNCRCYAEPILPGEKKPRNRFRAEAA